MGLLSFFSRKTAGQKAVSASPAVLEALSAGQANFFMPLGGTNRVNQRVDAAFVEVQNASYGWVYKYNPAVRTVIGYIAANIAQLGLKCFERISDDEREHRGDHSAAKALRNPNPQTPGGQFIFNQVVNFLIYDNAYALKFRQGNGELQLVTLTPHMVGLVGQNHFSVEAYRIFRKNGSFFDVSPEDVFHWRGDDPDDPRRGFSKLETLRQELATDRAVQASITELARAGLALPAWVERPLDAPEWSKDAADRWSEGFANQARDSTRHFPLLEEGMKLHQEGAVTPEDAQVLESRRFTLEQVAGIYGMKNVPPETEEERKQFYADVLPPITDRLASFLNLQVLQHEYAADDHYFEFNLDEKLIGDDRLKALTSAAGVPPLTRNEARARLNLPAKDGGDELITPMNVIVGDNPKPSPQVMPIQNPLGPEQDGSHRTEEPKSMNGNTNGQGKALLIQRRERQRRRQNQHAQEAAKMLQRYYRRQESSEKSKGAKAFDWTRWDEELTSDLYKFLHRVVELEGTRAAARLAMDEFDIDRAEAYLMVKSQETAKAINRTTREALQDADVTEVFDNAKGFRAAEAGIGLATFAGSWAQAEAGRQSPKEHLKTWIVTSGNSAHPEMNGETVPLGETFSNGTDGPPADHPACQCMLEIG